jgi:hypothetical protein
VSSLKSEISETYELHATTRLLLEPVDDRDHKHAACLATRASQYSRVDAYSNRIGAPGAPSASASAPPSLIPPPASPHPLPSPRLRRPRLRPRAAQQTSSRRAQIQPPSGTSAVAAWREPMTSERKARHEVRLLRLLRRRVRLSAASGKGASESGEQKRRRGGQARPGCGDGYGALRRELAELRVLVRRSFGDVCATRTRPSELGKVRRTKACVVLAQMDMNVQLARGVGSRRGGRSSASSVVAGRGRA